MQVEGHWEQGSAKEDDLDGALERAPGTQVSRKWGLTSRYRKI